MREDVTQESNSSLLRELQKYRAIVTPIAPVAPVAPFSEPTAPTAAALMPASEMIRTNSAANQPLKYEVYPFKTDEEIHAMQVYFLQKAKEAKRSSHPSRFYTWLRNFLYFSLSINIGFRGGDVTELTWDDLLNAMVASSSENAASNGYYIREEKTGKARKLVINSECRRAIEFYLNQLGDHAKDVLAPTIVRLPDAIDPKTGMPAVLAYPAYVFPSTKRNTKRNNRNTALNTTDVPTHVGRDSFCDIIQEAAKACGIQYHVGTHSLRKTFGYRFFKATGDVITLQKIFNHSSSAITLRYIGIDNEAIMDAYETVGSSGMILSDEELNAIMG